jgi:pyruvate kinase
MTECTKVIGTIGPASQDKAVLHAMQNAGVDCIRINTAHGSFKDYEEAVNLVRETTNAPVMIDVKGPELRVRTEDAIHVTANEPVRISCNGGDTRFSHDVFNDLSEGDSVFVDGGKYEATITEKVLETREIELVFERDAVIKPNKSVNVPGKELSLPSLSDKDREALRFVDEHSVSYVALSFTRTAQDVVRVQERLETDAHVIAKIENHEGVDNIDEILDVADGVMVARGDLGIELPQQKIPVVQKNLIKKALSKSKISIVATEMLESMTENPTPTRAEISDVANAVLDGADAVMLSGETAIGSYPAKAVQVMKDVAREIEPDIRSPRVGSPADRSEALSHAAYELSQRSGDVIVSISKTTRAAKLISRHRVHRRIIAVTDSEQTAKQLRLVWGVEPYVMDDIPTSFIIPSVTLSLVESDALSTDSTAVYFAGVGTAKEDEANLLEIHPVDAFLDFHGLQ